MDTRDPRNYGEWGSAERFVPAVILIGIGALFLLSNFHIFFIRDWWRYWPAILIAVGVVKLVDAADNSGRKGGAILLIVGSVFLADNLGFLSFSWTELWPLALIGVGVWMLMQRTSWPEPRLPGARGPAGPHESAVFGGGKRNFAGHEFRGGKYDAVFGGFEIDLRDATMPEDSAVLEVNAVFGGAEIRVPLAWNVDLRGAGVFGGYGDNTNHPAPQFPGMKRLIVKGSAVFGGVNVKN